MTKVHTVSCSLFLEHCIDILSRRWRSDTHQNSKHIFEATLFVCYFWIFHDVVGSLIQKINFACYEFFSLGFDLSKVDTNATCTSAAKYQFDTIQTAPNNLNYSTNDVCHVNECYFLTQESWVDNFVFDFSNNIIPMLTILICIDFLHE